MNAEYQRLEAEASGVVRRMEALSAQAGLRSAAELALLESEMASLGRKLSSFRLGQWMIRSIETPEFHERERQLIDSLPKRYHSQGMRTKTVSLPEGVEVKLEVRYDSRKKNPTAHDRRERGVYPGLLLLGIQERFPPDVRDRMAKAAALLAGEGIKVCVNTLRKVADSKRLKGAEKKRWLTTQKKRLLRGEIGAVVDELERLLGPNPTKDQKTWLKYFKTNGLKHRRMDYAETGAKKLPIGSGAVESAVRRVINLRVKSNATYLLRENAETMIRLRGWLKAGRGEELLRQTTCVTPQLAL